MLVIKRFRFVTKAIKLTMLLTPIGTNLLPVLTVFVSAVKGSNCFHYCLTEKVPIHYRSNKKLISPSAVTGHSDHGAEEEEEDPSGGRHPLSANQAPKQPLKSAPFLPGELVSAHGTMDCQIDPSW